VAYTPDWEPLRAALKRVVAAGIDQDQAQLDICGALADQKIAIRVTIDPADHDYGNSPIYRGNVEVPPHLSPQDFDWAHSRPWREWQVGPNPSAPAERYFSLASWKPRTIMLIELRTGDVSMLLCSGPSLSATALGSGKPELKRAPDAEIDGAIGVAYDEAAKADRKAPNVREIVALVQTILRVKGYEASGRRIQDLADADKHKKRRRQPGITVASEKRQHKN
jgi:hypothetical protein